MSRLQLKPLFKSYRNFFLALLTLLIPVLGITATPSSSSGDRPVSYWKLPGFLKKQPVEQFGGRIIEMPEYNSFYVFWIPEDEPKGIVIDVSEGLPYSSFKSWYPYVSQRDYAFISILSWQGGRQFLSPQKLYQMIEVLLKRMQSEHGLSLRRTLLHAHGTAVLQSLEMVLLDERQKNRFFKMVILNAGGYDKKTPPPLVIATKKLGSKRKKLYKGKSFFLYCGLNDPQPDVSGCDAMKRVNQFLLKSGGTILRFVQDATGGLDDFRNRPLYVEDALTLFESLK